MKLGKHQWQTVLLFTCPALLIYTLIVFVPIIWSSVYSIFDWNGIGSMKFVGFTNDLKLFTRDREFLPAFRHTIIYTAAQIALQVFVGLALAFLLSSLPKLRTFFQTMYYVPVVISSVALCQIFEKLMSLQPLGLFNSILGKINPAWYDIKWLTDVRLCLGSAAFVEGYKYMGMYMVIFYAALLGVPDELVEAAKIDGASSWDTAIHVKIPYIRNVIVANCVLVLNGSLRAYDIPYLLTNNGPGNSAQLLAPYMYKQAFSSMKYGYGSAVAVMIVIISLVFATVFRRIFERED